MEATDTFARHTSPHHDPTPTMLHRWFHKPRVKCLPNSSPAPFPTIRAPNLEFRLVREDNLAPIIWCPILMVNGPSEVFGNLVRVKEWLLSHYSGIQVGVAKNSSDG